MSVGSIGGLGGLGAMGAGMAVGAAAMAGPAGTGGLNGPLGDMNAATLSSMSGTRMDLLQELVEQFSSAEILIALMMAGASKSHKKHRCDGDSDLGMLLALSLASQLGQTLQQLQPMSAGVPAAAAATGMQINLTA